ncbi:putative integral membrane protein [Lachnospiraceae bacterium KM106-2]|nr:putative integral membrane protein [Lachnospiraceae bacterium KM106-2]
MTKEMFLNDLKRELNNMNRIDREKTIAYYEEMIDDRMESGLSEEAAIQDVGDPKNIAMEIVPDKSKGQWFTGNKLMTSTLLILGCPLWGSLLLAAIALIFSAYIMVWCAPIMTGGLCIGALVNAAASIIGAFILLPGSVGLAVFQVGVGVLSLGLSLLAAIGTCQVVTKVSKATAKLANCTTWIISLVRR